MNKHKSFIRSSSGPSYPYPRSHVPLMVVPTTRPLAPEDRPKTHKVAPRRRPPLNTAIPTIPESKSNESIMSHASRVSSLAEKTPAEPSPSCVVIENRAAVETLQRESKSSGIPRRSVDPMKKSGKTARAADAPRSPLMSVAHSVRSKLTKLTRMGKSEPSSMRGSQSFSGARVTKSGIPKRIDANANTVIKSASMDVPLTTEPSTSKVVIPQSSDPLVSEEPSLAESIPKETVESSVKITKQSPTPTSELEIMEVQPEPIEEICVSVEMKEDSIVVTNEKQMEEKEEEPKNENTCSTQFEETIVRTVVTKREGMPLSVSFSTKDEILETSPVQSPGDKENEPSLDMKTPRMHRKSIEEHLITEKHVTTIERKEENIQIEETLEKVEVIQPNASIATETHVSRKIEESTKLEGKIKETAKSPERYVMTVKTPEAQRKNQVFVISQKESSEKVVKIEEPLVKERKLRKWKGDKLKRSKSAEVRPQPRYVMAVKTSDALRRHHTFVVGEGPPKKQMGGPPGEESVRMREKSKRKEGKIKRHKSMPEREAKSPERFVMIAKTPEGLRRHHTFVIGEGHPKTKDERVLVEKREKTKKRIVRQRSSPEEAVKSPERFVLVTKTPLFLRRYHTFMVGDRAPTPDFPFIEEGELTEPIATVGPSAYKKRTRSEEPRRTEEKPKERYVLTTRTPLAMRKFQTFVVENKKEAQLPTSASANAKIITTKCTEVKTEKVESSVETPLILSTTNSEEVAKLIEENALRFKPIKHKSFDETRPMTPEKYMLTSSSPLTMRKAEEKPRELWSISPLFPPPPNEVEMESDTEEPYVPIKPKDMYVLTATTPLPQRKQRVEPIKNGRKESELEKIARDKSRDTSKSPERTTLFVMGRRSPPQNNNVFVVSEKPKQTLALAEPAISKQNLRLDEVKTISPNSDKAERRMSNVSGEMTSPEEDIPMDTQQTPSEDEAEQTIAIKSIPIESVQTVPEQQIREAPVFRPPSPPKEVFSPVFSSKSTSPIKSSEAKSLPVATLSPSTKNKSKHLFRSSSADKRDKKMEKLEKEREQRERKEEKEKEKPPKTPLSARSLRSAGKMFTPAFLRKDGKHKTAKPANVSKSMSFGARTNMDLAVRNRRAPLAEFESSRVANSPLVENNPISFDKWNSSPRTKRRHSEKSKIFSDPITEESDGNGNVAHIGIEKIVASPTMGRHEQDKGDELIDDEILDQPMLMGDSFSPSESMDGISLHRREFEAEKATLISIDRSLADEIDTPRRPQENNNRPPPPPSCAATVFSCQPDDKKIQDGLNEVQDIKSQLEKLQELIAQEQERESVNEHDALVKENDALRRQLIEKDQVINALKLELASLKA